MLAFLYSFSGWGTVALRLAIGAVFIVHGWQKVQKPGTIASVWGGSKALGLVHGLVEVIGGVALVFGFWIGRSTVVLSVIMLGAIFYKTVKWKVPFKSSNSTGWEFDLVVLAGLLTLLLG